MKSAPEFQLALRSAVRRQKLRRAARTVRAALPLTASLAIVGIVLALVAPQLFAGSARLTLLLLALGLLALLLVPVFRRMSPIQAAKALDQDLHLPDSALAWVQFSDSGTWWDALRAETLGRLRSAVSPTLRSDKNTLILAMILIVTLLAGSWIWIPSVPQGSSGVTMPADLTSLDQVLEDWATFAESNPNRLGDEMKEAAKALEAALQDREADRSNLLVRIATVEDRLQANLSSLDSLQSLLSALAEALSADSSQSSPPPSASEALDKLAAQLPADFTPANASELEELARQLSEAGHTELAEALKALAKSTDGKQAQEALKKLSKALSGAEALADAKRMMELAMMQLAAAKEGTGSGSEGALSMLPKLSDSGNPGSGAGSDPDFPESKTVRALEAAPLLAPVTSANQSAGEAQIQVLPTAEGLQESPTRAPSSTAVSKGPLSEEAITSEDLPVVHRATVRRYFESIRPKTETP